VRLEPPSKNRSFKRKSDGSMKWTLSLWSSSTSTNLLG
jgi:hypothetical protein